MRRIGHVIVGGAVADHAASTTPISIPDRGSIQGEVTLGEGAVLDLAVTTAKVAQPK